MIWIWTLQQQIFLFYKPAAFVHAACCHDQCYFFNKEHRLKNITDHVRIAAEGDGSILQDRFVSGEESPLQYQDLFLMMVIHISFFRI